MANNLSELDKLTKVSASGSVAKVRRDKKKGNSENARNLLGSILDDSAAAAEEERKRLEENRRHAEEEARLAKEREEEKARLEAERAIIAEQQAQEDIKMRQAEMQAQLQREKDIEAGLIDLEEEARQKKAEEERQRAAAAEKQRKTEAKLQAIELKRNQEDELEALKREQMAKNAEPKKNILPFVIAAAAVFIVIIGTAVFALTREEPVDPYALADDYETRVVSFLQDDPSQHALTMSNHQIVAQAAPVKAAPKHSGKKKAAGAAPAAEAPKPKVSLTGGKGGLFGNKKL